MEFSVVCQLNRGRLIEARPSSLIPLTGWLEQAGKAFESIGQVKPVVP